MEIAAFIARCDAYCANRAPPLSRSRLSTILFDDGKRIDAIANGAEVGHRRLMRASAALTGLESSLAETRPEAA